MLSQAQNILSLFSTETNMVGGLKKKVNQFQIFIILVILLLIKGLLVYLIYNMLMPKILYSLSTKKDKNIMEITNNFRELTYFECLMLVILTNTLFSN